MYARSHIEHYKSKTFNLSKWCFSVPKPVKGKKKFKKDDKKKNGIEQ